MLGILIFPLVLPDNSQQVAEGASFFYLSLTSADVRRPLMRRRILEFVCALISVSVRQQSAPHVGRDVGSAREPA